MADLKKCFELRAERLTLQKQVDKLEQEEKDLLYEIQKYMDRNVVSSLSDGTYNATLKTSDEPLVTDWLLTLEYIREHGSTDLLQRRLTVSAVKSRWDAGVDVPGVSKFVKNVVTITKE